MQTKSCQDVQNVPELKNGTHRNGSSINRINTKVVDNIVVGVKMQTKIFVSVRDRFESTIRCIDSLGSTTLELADIFIFDNNSCKDLSTLMSYYNKISSAPNVGGIYLNRQAALKDVYWSKAFSWIQFLNIISLYPENERRYIVMVDNDVMFTQNWLQASIALLESPIANNLNIKVVCPWNGNPKYPTLETIKFDKYLIDIRNHVGSPCWVSTYEYWRSLKTPPYGMKDAFPDDVWHWDQIVKRGDKFGVFTNGFVKDITASMGGSKYSARLKYVGLDYPPR